MSNCSFCGLPRDKCHNIIISPSETLGYYRVTIKGKYSIIHSKEELIGLREKLNDLDLCML